MIKLVLSDLDDTLIHFGLPRATDFALDAILSCQKAGVQFAAATGRVYEALGWMFDNRPYATKTAVCTNGQVVVLDGKVIHTEELSRTSLEKLLDLCKRWPHTYLVTYTGEAAYIVSPKDVLPPTQAQIDTIYDPHIVQELPEDPLVKANIHVGGDRELVVKIKTELEAALPDFDFVLPTPKAPLIDIAPKGWGKGAGAHVLCDALGLRPDEVAVFGDSENDLDLLNAFPNSVAVSNAMPVVAKTARFHIGDTKDDAVAHALLDIAEATSKGELPAFMRGDAK